MTVKAGARRWPARSSATRAPSCAPTTRTRIPTAAVRLRFAEEVLDELERRKRRLRHPRLRRPADRLAESPCRTRTPRPATGCSSAGVIVLVDEFQDTDPIQWQVIEKRVQRALHADPDRRPEAGDLWFPRRRHPHLPEGGPRPPTTSAHVGTNWRSDKVLVREPADGAGRRGARPSRHRGVRRRRPARRTPTGRGAAQRAVPAAGRQTAHGRLPSTPTTCRSTVLRSHIPADLAADIARAAGQRRHLSTASRSGPATSR